MGSPFENLVAFLLSDASEHAKSFALVLFLELIQPIENLLFGLIANAAGVVKQQIGFGGALGLRIATRKQRADHFLRVVDVHLTAKRLDVELLHARFFLLSVAQNA